MLDFKLSFNEHCDNVLGNKQNGSFTQAQNWNQDWNLFKLNFASKNKSAKSRT